MSSSSIGCAGHTAALYTARANLKPLLVEGHEPGGQLSLTTLVENFPAFPKNYGPQLVENMRKQAERSAPNTVWHISPAPTSASARSSSIWCAQVHAQSLISPAALPPVLGLPNEQKLIGHGVSSCATATAFSFQEKKSWWSAGRFRHGGSPVLTRFAPRSRSIHRRDSFRASRSCWNAPRRTTRSSSSRHGRRRRL